MSDQRRIHIGDRIPLEGFAASRRHLYRPEAIYAEEWGKRHALHLSSPPLIHYLITEPTERDCVVAATIIQWLGSNIGQEFVQGAQAKIESEK